LNEQALGVYSRARSCILLSTKAVRSNEHVLGCIHA
jgi:hypothetical protein